MQLPSCRGVAPVSTPVKLEISSLAPALRLSVFSLVLCASTVLVPTAPATATVQVAIYSTSFGAEVVLPTGYSASEVLLGAIVGGILPLYDVLVIGDLNSVAWSQDACDELESFVRAGGGLVTEWNGATLLFSSIDPQTFQPVSPPCQLFAGSISDGYRLDEGWPIFSESPGHPLMEGLPAWFELGGGGEFFYRLEDLPSSWNVTATYPTSGGPSFPAIATAPLGSGRVVVGTFDYFEAIPEYPLAVQLLTNMIGVAAGNEAADGALFSDGFENGTFGAWSAWVP